MKVSYIQLVLYFMGLAVTATFVVQRIRASSERTAERLDGIKNELLAELRAVHNTLEARREEFAAFAAEIRATLLDHAKSLREHEGRLGDFEGGRNAWLALRDRNGAG